MTVGAENQVATGIRGIDLLDPEPARGFADRGDSHQVLRGLGQQAEAVDHFDLQFAQVLRGLGRRDTLVQYESQVDIRNVVVG